MNQSAPGHQTKKFLTQVAASEKLHPYFYPCELDCGDEGVWRVTSIGGFDYGSKVPKEGGMMQRKVLIIVLAIALWPLCSEALTREDFLVNSTQDLVKLCAASESDPLYQAAIGFCHGYMVGVNHYYQATTAGAGQREFVCFPEPRPTRAEAIQMFVAWTKQNPQYMSERPVDSIFRFLESKFPCRR
jgi:Rap1a immunity proteins